MVKEKVNIKTNLNIKVISDGEDNPDKTPTKKQDNAKSKECDN